MSNLPREHHHLDTHARHRDKTLAALLWTARFRWTASGAIDDLLGGNGLVRKLIERKLLVEHPINDPFSPVRYYATLSREGLALLQRQWVAIGNGLHGETATRLSDCWTLPERPEHRIREARFMHDLHVQALLAGAFRTNYPIACIHLADDLERCGSTQRIGTTFHTFQPRKSRTPSAFSRAFARGEDTACTAVQYPRLRQPSATTALTASVGAAHFLAEIDQGCGRSTWECKMAAPRLATAQAHARRERRPTDGAPAAQSLRQGCRAKR